MNPTPPWKRLTEVASPPWKRLTEVAEKRRDAHAQRLGALTRQRDDAQRQLDLLLSYRADYETRLAQASSQGIELTVLRNYQSFLAQLERAIAQQTEIVGQAERNMNGAKAQWCSEHQRVESFQTLDERHLENAARNEQRRDQKLTDEWALRNGAHASAKSPDPER
jgi:flagellar FliJ protein